MDILLLALRIVLALTLYGFIAAVFIFIWRDLRAASFYSQRIPEATLYIPGEGEESVGYKLIEENIIGRAPENSIPVFDETVSFRHARLAFNKGQWLLEDLGSRNGTRVNDIRVDEPLVLADGDHIHLGKVELRFEQGSHNPRGTKS